MANFDVVLSNKAEKFLLSLERKLKEQIDVCLKELQYVPVPAKDYNLAKVKGSSATYRIRIQRIRIIYDVYWGAKRI